LLFGLAGESVSGETSRCPLVAGEDVLDAPLGHTIGEIPSNEKCNVLIGVKGKYGTLLRRESVLSDSRKA
jgi:hypothetical protein